MTTISLRFNERNLIAQKTIEYILSLGIFSKVETDSAAKRRTLKAVKDMHSGNGVTRCNTFEEYLNAVKE